MTLDTDAKVKEKISNVSDEEYSLGLKDLKNIFPELKSAEDFSLIPLFDRITRMFMVDLKQNPSDYNISFLRYLGKDNNIPRCHYYEKGRIYCLIVGSPENNKVISMNIHKIDINPISNMDPSFSRRHYWMTNRVTLKGNKTIQLDTLSNLFKSFIQKQNLEKLIEESKQEILEIEAHRTDTGFARPKEFHDFYFEEKPIEYEYEDIL